jgi:hypothetical protein
MQRCLKLWQFSAPTASVAAGTAAFKSCQELLLLLLVLLLLVVRVLLLQPLLPGVSRLCHVACRSPFDAASKANPCCTAPTDSSLTFLRKETLAAYERVFDASSITHRSPDQAHSESLTMIRIQTRSVLLLL